MKAFFNILQKCANSTAIFYPDKPIKTISTNQTSNNNNNNNNNDFLKTCYIYNIICKIYKEYIKNFNSVLAKMTVFHGIVNDIYPFLFLPKYKECLLDIFSRAQRIYNAFTRLAYIYRLKKYKTVVTDDLSMNPLDINHKNTFILIQNKSKYLFSLNDVVKIIETAITHAPNFFQEPKNAKNPYNNEVLNRATLYNIYFKMKASERVMSTVFHLYFLYNFELKKFTLNNEPFLRDITLQKYIYNSPSDTLHKFILTMLKANFYTRKLTIHKDFPKELLVEIFKPFLYYYYIVNYDIQGTQRISNYKHVLYIKLKKFYEYNKTFGRKIIHAKPKIFNSRFNSKSNNKLNNLFNTTWVPFSFITHHITFYNIRVNEPETEGNMLFYITHNVAPADSEDDSVTNTNSNTNANSNVNSDSEDGFNDNDNDDTINSNSEDGFDDEDTNDELDDVLDDVSIS